MIKLLKKNIISTLAYFNPCQSNWGCLIMLIGVDSHRNIEIIEAVGSLPIRQAREDSCLSE